MLLFIEPAGMSLETKAARCNAYGLFTTGGFAGDFAPFVLKAPDGLEDSNLMTTGMLVDIVNFHRDADAQVDMFPAEAAKDMPLFSSEAAAASVADHIRKCEDMAKAAKRAPCPDRYLNSHWAGRCFPVERLAIVVPPPEAKLAHMVGLALTSDDADEAASIPPTSVVFLIAVRPLCDLLASVSRDMAVPCVGTPAIHTSVTAMQFGHLLIYRGTAAADRVTLLFVTPTFCHEHMCRICSRVVNLAATATADASATAAGFPPTCCGHPAALTRVARMRCVKAHFGAKELILLQEAAKALVKNPDISACQAAVSNRLTGITGRKFAAAPPSVVERQSVRGHACCATKTTKRLQDRLRSRSKLMRYAEKEAERVVAGMTSHQRQQLLAFEGGFMPAFGFTYEEHFGASSGGMVATLRHPALLHYNFHPLECLLRPGNAACVHCCPVTPDLPPLLPLCDAAFAFALVALPQATKFENVD